MASDQQKPPSELSFDIFLARIAADQTLPHSVREAIATNQNKGTPTLLAAINKAIGGASEA